MFFSSHRDRRFHDYLEITRVAVMIMLFYETLTYFYFSRCDEKIVFKNLENMSFIVLIENSWYYVVVGNTRESE